MRFINPFIFVFFVCTLAVANNWHDERATYRVEFLLNEPSDISLFDAGHLIYPDNFENGISVYSSEGDRIPYHIDRSSGTIFMKSGGKDRLFLYFGFPERKPISNWDENKHGRIPSKTNLEMRAIRAWFEDIHESKVLEDPIYLKYLEFKRLECERTKLEFQLRSYNSYRDEANSLKEISEDLVSNWRNRLKDLKTELKRLSEENTKYDSELKKFNNREKIFQNHFNIRNTSRQYEIREIARIENLRDLIDWKGKKDYAVMVQGQLKIDKEGEYDFAIDSTGSTQLFIEDVPVVEWFYRHPRNRGWDRRGSIYLFPGVYNLRFFAHVGEKSEFASAAWKRADDSEFRILKSDDFTGSLSIVPRKCSGKELMLLPLISGRSTGRVFIDRKIFFNWIDFSLIPTEEIASVDWIFSSNRISARDSVQFFISEDLSQTELKVIFDVGGSYQSEVNVDLNKIKLIKDVVEFDLNCGLSVPQFIFDDEVLDMRLEFYSGNAERVIALMKMSVVPENRTLKSEMFWVDFPADVRESKYSSPVILDKVYRLDGSALAVGQHQVRFLLSVLPYELWSKSLSFIPLLQCPELQSPDGLFLHDTRGRKVIPILHRPTLAEKREWSFSDTIKKDLRRLSKVTIIGDDFEVNRQKFSGYISKLFGAKKVNCCFISWGAGNANSTMMRKLGQLLKEIKSLESDRLIIIPSSIDNHMAVSARLQVRVISAILQIARSNKKIKEIYVCTSLPLPFHNPIEEDLNREIRRNLKEDFALDKVIDLYSFVKKHNNWEEFYREELSSSSVYSLFPLHMIEQISYFLVEEN